MKNKENAVAGIIQNSWYNKTCTEVISKNEPKAYTSDAAAMPASTDRIFTATPIRVNSCARSHSDRVFNRFFALLRETTPLFAFSATPESCCLFLHFFL